ncbi:MAG: sulfotransferase [Gammaproteobacteria bacterium]|nr:sulfotransferase [Gammaproteobacteria bacterium]
MPDVFILGFTKCATTSMYNQLMQHDDVSNTKRKEPHFHFSQIMGDRFSGPADNDTVNQMFVTDPKQYLNLYEPGKLSIDGSAMSVIDPKIIESVDRQYPNAKYIIVLRDPIDRAFSAYSHLIRDARETRNFRSAIDHEISGKRKNYMPIWHNINSSRYVDAVQHARKMFGDRLKVVAYIDYAKNNQQTMDDIAHFLGLSSIIWSRDHANRSGIPKSKLFQKMLMRQSLAKTAFIKAFPESFVSSLKRNLMERNTGPKPTLTNQDRGYFKSCIADEYCKIELNTPDSELLLSLYSK